LVNAAAYTAVDQAESKPERAYAVNSTGPAYLAEACAEFNIPLVHFSSDYVFDGTASRAYREDDPINPLGIYGKSKAEGEERIKSICQSYIILRTSWVFSATGITL
jgi:dTDP-4-dehydrorhamnose reductase